jgi:hypothetical protein
MSLDRKRWALMAYELRFGQLEAARKQAEAWRTGLASLTALLAAVLVIKGRDNVSALAEPYRWLAVALLGAALGLLLFATMLVARAIAGPPGDEILLSGEGLRAWTAREVDTISRAVRWAPRLAVAGVVSVALAVGVTWLAPAAGSAGPLIRVNDGNGQVCGQMIGVSQHELIVRTSGKTALLPLSAIADIEPVAACG